MNINLTEQTISFEELDKLAAWIKTYPRLTKGKLTSDFEAKFSPIVEQKYSVFVNSGSSANLLMALALKESGKLKNNVVIAPAVSWVTTVTPFMQFGFDVQLCDCNLENLGLDLEALEEICIKKNPSVLITCNVLGHPNHYKQIEDICDKYDILLIEDNCESLGSKYNSRKLGNYGLMSSHSFYFGHHISTIEGGMVSTSDENFYNILLSLRSHGWNRDLTKPFIDKFSSGDSFRDMYTFYFPGLNVRSTDLNAFIGINQLKKIDEFSKIREKNFYKYKEMLSDYWYQNSDAEIISSFAYGTLVNNPKELYESLKHNNIESRPLICGNISRHPFWKKGGSDNFPNANIIHDHGIYLPNHSELDQTSIEIIADIVKKNSEPFKNVQ